MPEQGGIAQSQDLPIYQKGKESQDHEGEGPYVGVTIMRRRKMRRWEMKEEPKKEKLKVEEKKLEWWMEKAKMM